MRPGGLAAVAALIGLLLLAGPVLGQDQNPPPPCPSSNASTENLTATFAGEPPRTAFPEHELHLPPLQLSVGEGGPDEVQVSVVVTGSANVVNGSEDVATGGDAVANLSFPASEAFGEADSADLHVCGNGKKLQDAQGDTLNWTLERLPDYGIELRDPSFRPHDGSGDVPDLPTTETDASIPLYRNLTRYHGVEDRQEVRIVTDATVAGGCPDTTEPPTPSFELPSNRAQRLDLDLSQAPACEVTFTFAVELLDEYCAKEREEDCRVSSTPSRTFVVHRPWRLLVDAPQDHGPMMDERVWAPENDRLPALESAIDAFQEERAAAYEAYEDQLDSGDPDVGAIREAQRNFETAVATVQDRFDEAGEQLRFVTGLASAQAAFETGVEEDRATFEERVSTYVEDTYAASEEDWWTARQWFAYGFAPALIVGFAGFLLFTRRWRKKTEYWSMFSSKASFTHPLHAAAGVAVIGVGAAVAVGLVHETFTLHRILGIPADLWRLIG